MEQGTFRFYEDLNDFLHESKKGKVITSTFNGDQSVKHLIESLGVPHTEVSHILVNGKQVDFGYLVRDGDMVEVYPFAIGSGGMLILGKPIFVLDNHLGQLATYLRMLGFDTLYRNDYHDDELAQISSEEGRILLTRDRRLLMRNKVQHGYWVRYKIPRRQLVEVLRRFDLCNQVTPFQRCMRCNGLLLSVSKDEVLHRLEPLTRKYFEQFRICQDCDQVYWKGSHHERMMRFIDQALAEVKQ